MGSDNTRKVKIYTGKALKDILNRQNGFCLYCGKKVNIYSKYTFNREHIIPRAIYKWLEYTKLDKEIDLEKLWKLSTSKESVAVVHPKCNTKRGSVIHTDESIDKMCVDTELKEYYRHLTKECKLYIDAYKEIIKTVAISQNNRCINCGVHLDIDTSTLRRINNKKYRTIDNAVVLCEKCSSIPRRKIRTF